MVKARIATWGIGLSLLVATGLAACTSDQPGSGPTSTGTGSSSSSAPADSLPGKDVSAEILGTPAIGEPVATLTDPPVLERWPANTAIHIYSIKAGETGTVLTYSGTADGIGTNGWKEISWPRFPVLVDPATQKGYRVSTYPYADDKTVCLCVMRAAIVPTPKPTVVYYPPLPTGITEVILRIEGWSEVKVPVTR